MDKQPFFEELAAFLSDRHGMECLRMEKIEGGTNNQVYRLETKEHGLLCVKKYFKDERGRLDHEFRTLDALSRSGFLGVPRTIARVDALDCGVYEFVDGKCIPSAELTIGQVDKIVNFLVRLHQVPSGLIDYPGFNAVQSLHDWPERTLRWRLDTFNKSRQKLHPLAAEFEQKERVVEFVTEEVRKLEDQLKQADFDPQDFRISPIDFGPHNMLWRADGMLTVIDWEYSGLDHPLRTVGDFYAHDRTNDLDPALRQYFLNEYQAHSPLSTKTLELLPLFINLCALEWILIQLCFMMPSKMERMEHAGIKIDWNESIQRQMKRVRERMEAYKK